MVRHSKKRMGYGDKDVVERFMYPYGTTNPIWIISPQPLIEPTPTEGVAYCQDRVDRPGMINKPWSTYNPHHQRWEKYDEVMNEERLREQEKLRKETRWGAPPRVHLADNIVVKSIVGFDIQGVAPSEKVVPGLMLRHNKELFGRPTYESESGSQFLYWLRDDLVQVHPVCPVCKGTRDENRKCDFCGDSGKDPAYLTPLEHGMKE